MCPHDADAVLVFDRESKTTSFLQHKSLQPGGKKYVGICQGSDQRLYCAPFDANDVLVINPFPGWGEEEISFIPNPRSGEKKYMGICLAADGRLYCAPQNASSV